MKTDRELLELAAKAAGIPIERSRLDDPMWRDMLVETSNRDDAGRAIGWNPLTDDGDALRLAVKLKLRVSSVCNSGDQSVASATDMYIDACVEDHNGDPYAATRRAIVRAAAAIGEVME